MIALVLLDTLGRRKLFISGVVVMTLSMASLVMVAAITAHSDLANLCVNQHVIEAEQWNTSDSAEQLTSESLPRSGLSTTEVLTESVDSDTTPFNSPLTSIRSSSIASKIIISSSVKTSTLPASSTTLPSVYDDVTTHTTSDTFSASTHSDHITTSRHTSTASSNTQTLSATETSPLISSAYDQQSVTEDSDIRSIERGRRSGHEVYADHSVESNLNDSNTSSERATAVKWTAVAVLVVYVAGYEVGFGTGNSCSVCCY